MKTVVILLMLVCLSSAAYSQETVAQASKAAYNASLTEAVKEYPELAKADSEFNQHFLKLMRAAKDDNDPLMQSPDWPMTLAKKAADEMHLKPVKQALDHQGGLSGGGGLQKIVSLSVDQVAESPFSLEGSMVKLSGIDRVEVQEVEKGIYEVTIWSPNSNNLKATITADHADAVKQATSLYVSVEEAKKYGTKVIIHGMAVHYEGLSTVPTVSW